MIAIYVRVSTEEQSLKGYSVNGQIDDCIQKAGTSDVLKYIDDGWTGEILDRPAMINLRNDVRAGIVTKVICYDPDRLSRSLMNQLIIDDEFRSQGVPIIFVNGEYANTPEGRMFFQMRGAISEFEKAKIKERTVGGKKRKAKEGKVLGNYGLYGYDYDKEKGYVINPETSEVVKMIFDLWTKPDSPCKGMNSIALYLTNNGIPTATGKKVWHRNVVRQMLYNESYTGRHPQMKTDNVGDYVRMQSGLARQQKSKPKEEWIYTEIPRIISDEQYERAQELLGVARRRFSKESKNQYLLSGLVRCSDCQNTMIGTKASWWGEKITMYTDIKNSAGAKNPGCGNKIRTEKLEEAVWEHLIALFNDPEAIQKHKEETANGTNYNTLIRNLEKKIKQEEQKRTNLIALVAASNGQMDLSEITVQISRSQKDEKDYRIQLDHLKEEQKKLTKQMDDSVFKKGLEMYLHHKGKSDQVPFEDKKEIIRTVVKQIYLSKDKENLEIHLF